MTTSDGSRRKRLGEILLAGGVLTRAQLEEALLTQSTNGRRQRLGATIVELGMCDEQAIADALAQQLRLDTVDLTSVGPESPALARVHRKVAERYHALPLRFEEDDVLVVAMSDPTNVVALDDLRLTSKVKAIRAVVATETDLSDALRRAYGSDQAALDMVEDLGDGEVVSVDEATEDLANDELVDDQPIIRLANAILADAVRTRASDVHVEPEREHLRVRYRIDGLLKETMRVPKHIGPALTSRLKIMSNLDIAERRRPQDGRAMIRVEGQEVDLRVSTMPTMFGETVVMRLLRKGAERLGVHDLGLPADVHDRFDSALHRPQGLIVITGPTGSGKTTTLYAGLTELADPVRNIITLEDPIEYQLEGVNQTQVNPKIDLTFARGLRTVLRQDPDVVMVGEIRDGETAELAMEASFTGHLVLSTLHTNDAPSTVIRLVDLGVERFLISSSLLLVVAQRLVRVVCSHCRQRTEPDPKTLRLLGLEGADLTGVELLAGAGCQLCEHTGYRGRLGVYELLTVTPRMRDLITSGGSELELGSLARQEGMRTLREDGIAKAFAGVTTLEEVLRVTPEQDVSLERILPDEPLAPVVTVPVRPEPAKPRPAVLVVDDDASVRELLGMVLADDFEVLEASDGAEALRLESERHPDAMILDHKLPDLTGIEVAQRLRDEGRHLPILMVTGLEDPSIEVDGLLAGIDDFLAKPFDEEVLLTRLRQAIRRRVVA